MNDIKTIRDDIASIKADLADGETTFEHAVECLTDAANTATDVADAEKARADEALSLWDGVRQQYADARVRVTSLERERDRANGTARHIIAVCEGNGGVEGLGGSDVETAIKRMVLHDAEQTQRLVGQLDAAEAKLANLLQKTDAAEPDTAIIECPVKCEGCSVVLPMAAALHTEDPVYLCGKCAAGAVASERDAAEAKVCELVEVLRYYAERAYESRTDSDGSIQHVADAALALTADIRAKWIPEKEHDLIIDGIYETRNHASGAQLAKTEAERNAALRERDEVGVQLVAAQERLALAMETVDALSMTCLMWSRPDKIKEAKADVMFVRGSLDAVPGDALGTPFDEAGTTNPDKKGTQ